MSSSQQTSVNRRDKAGRIVASWLALLVVWVSVNTVRGEGATKEYELKAVLLWRLAQYVEFPPEAFSNPDSPLIIGVIGENPFGEALLVATRDETAHGRKIVVRYYREPNEIAQCHVLFIAPSERHRARAIVADLRNRAALTVSDLEGFVRYDNGMVRLATEQGKVGLMVNLEAVTKANLKIDGRLLRMAQIVNPR